MATTRINRLRRKLQSENLEGIVVTNPEQIRHLCGFSGSSGLLVLTRSKAEFLTDFRYLDQAKEEVRGAKVTVVKGGDLISNLKQVAALQRRNARLAFSGEYVSVSARERLASALPGVLWVNGDRALADMGWVKDRADLEQIKKAVAIGDEAFKRILGIIRPGVREKELAAELEYQMLMLGSERPAFESIVASGYRSAMPHGLASGKKIAKGDFITFDFGATVGGVVSDMTRTIVVGKATPRQKKIYALVLKAQLAGIARVRAGVDGKSVDEACRSIITKAGYGKNFGHGTGHGIGFFIHMGPRAGLTSTDKLMINNVITIEPGVYISGWGGVRIEDDVLVTGSGGKVLNKAPKNLLEL